MQRGGGGGGEGGGGVVRFLDYFRCYMRGEGGDTNLDVPPPILIFHNYYGDPLLEK